MDRREGREGRAGLIWALMTRVWRVPRVRQTAHPARSRLSSVQPAPSVREPSLQPFPFVHHVRLRNHTGTPPLSPSLCCHRSPFSSTGPAQGYSGLLPCHPDFPPTLLGLLPPRRHLRPRILFLNVCICLSTLSCPTPVMTPAPSPHSLPKEKIPVRELAVASTASLLGGFGVVALFCSVGVYV